MFERTFVQNGAVSRRPFTMAVSLLSQCLFVGLGAVIPLLYTSALPLRGWVSQSLAEPPPTLGGLPREPQSTRQPKGRAPRRFETESLPRSTTIPEKAALVTEASDILPAADVSQNNLGAGVPGGVLGSAGLGGNGFAELLARPPAPHDAERSEVEVSGEPMEIGGEVQASEITSSRHARLSLACTAGSRRWPGPSQSHHQRGRIWPPVGGAQRSSTVGGKRGGSGQALALPADAAEQACRGGYHAN